MQFKLKNSQLLTLINEWIINRPTQLSENKTEDIKIAFGEILQNIIRHGYKNNLNKEDFIDIEYQNDHDKLTFIVRDYAQPCDPTSFLNKEFKPNESGHMGLSIIRKLTNEFTIRPLKDGNETRLSFNINNLIDN